MIAVNSLCFLAAGKDLIISDSLLQYVNMCSIRFRTAHIHTVMKYVIQHLVLVQSQPQTNLSSRLVLSLMLAVDKRLGIFHKLITHRICKEKISGLIPRPHME